MCKLSLTAAVVWLKRPRQTEKSGRWRWQHAFSTAFGFLPPEPQTELNVGRGPYGKSPIVNALSAGDDAQCAKFQFRFVSLN